MKEVHVIYGEERQVGRDELAKILVPNLGNVARHICVDDLIHTFNPHDMADCLQIDYNSRISSPLEQLALLDKIRATGLVPVSRQGQEQVHSEEPNLVIVCDKLPPFMDILTNLSLKQVFIKKYKLS